VQCNHRVMLTRRELSHRLKVILQFLDTKQDPQEK
jgi:hypothetical protein